MRQAYLHYIRTVSQPYPVPGSVSDRISTGTMGKSPYPGIIAWNPFVKCGPFFYLYFDQRMVFKHGFP